MNTYILLERIFSSIIGCAVLTFMFLFYGEYKIKRWKCVLVYVGVCASLGIIYKTLKLVEFNPVAIGVVLVIATIMVDLVFILLLKGKWYLNWLTIEIYWAIDGIMATIDSILYERILDTEFLAEPIVHNMNQLMVNILWNVVICGINGVLTTFIMCKLFSYDKIQKDTLGNNIYWCLQLITILGSQMLCGILHPELDSEFMVMMLIISVIGYIVVHYIYTFTINIHRRRQIRHVKNVIETENQSYHDILEKYNDIRDVKHDIDNHRRNLELLEDAPDLKEEYKEEVLHKINKVLDE